MRNYLLYIIFFCQIANHLVAQVDSTLLTKNFKFRDGVYVTFQDFQRNRPSYQWEALHASLATTEEGFVAQVASIKFNGKPLDLQQIWGICMGGIPYIRLPQGEVTDAATVFVGLRVRGKICYFKYKTNTTEMVEVRAYNPLNGRPYRQGLVPVQRTVLREYMLNWQTADIEPFTTDIFLQWIEDDPQLWRTVKDLSIEEADEKLFRCLLIYVDRNPVYLYSQ